MPQNDEAPAEQAGATCDKLAGGSHFPLNPLTLQIQRLVANYAVRPELAAVLAAAAYGGGSHGR